MKCKVLVNDDAPSRALMANLRPGDRVAFTGTNIALELVAKSGRTALLRIFAPETVRIERTNLPLVGSDTSMAGLPRQAQTSCAETVVGA